ncbi:ATP-dependent DNA helicase PIF1 (DNA repair and recombination helicase PIF1), partial [Durusdinium trenchii]
TGDHTDEDINTLKGRVKAKAKPRAVCLYATRAAVDTANGREFQKLEKDKQQDEIFDCIADDRYEGGTFEASPLANAYMRAEDTGGLQTKLVVCVGTRVMLRLNLRIEDGLTNGACGYITEIDSDEHRVVSTIYVQFDGEVGKLTMSEFGGSSVAIAPHTMRFTGKDGKTVRRRQFPLVHAWSKTIHKSQGATEREGVKTRLDKKKGRALAYVAFSRCQTLNDLSLDGFNADSIQPAVGVQWAINQLLLQQAKSKDTST